MIPVNQKIFGTPPPAVAVVENSQIKEHIMAAAKKKKFSELSLASKVSLITAATAQITLLIAAQIDLSRRDSSQVRGNKPVWAAVNFISFIGPLSYFTFGRTHNKR
ncbi:PLD nuclease N-terminal domain-containing protein [Glutamicibacter halophytocola]|nr:PLD nuclease N-terminal domain-containing protein [Glutamicibacter halophytocola]